MQYDFSAYTDYQLKAIIVVNDRTIRDSTDTYNKLIEAGVSESYARGVLPRSTLWEWTDQAEQELKRREEAREPSNAV
jgi:thymidylate synthase ThyX